MTVLDQPEPRLVAVTIDCNDLERMAAFWSELLTVEVRAIEDGFAFLTAPSGSGVSIWLQKVPEQSSEKARIHLDLASSDLEETLAVVTRIGGTVGAAHEWHGYEWRQCFDPEGNVFDVMRTPQTAEDETAADDG